MSVGSTALHVVAYWAYFSVPWIDRLECIQKLETTMERGWKMSCCQ